MGDPNIGILIIRTPKYGTPNFRELNFFVAILPIIYNQNHILRCILRTDSPVATNL